VYRVWLAFRKFEEIRRVGGGEIPEGFEGTWRSLGEFGGFRGS